MRPILSVDVVERIAKCGTTASCRDLPNIQYFVQLLSDASANVTLNCTCMSLPLLWRFHFRPASSSHLATKPIRIGGAGNSDKRLNCDYSVTSPKTSRGATQVSPADKSKWHSLPATVSCNMKCDSCLHGRAPEAAQSAHIAFPQPPFSYTGLCDQLADRTGDRRA